MGHAELGSPRAMQAEHLGALVGTESLDELSFQQLLDLQNEASEDDTWDTFNDVSRELKARRVDAKVALVKVFVEQAKQDGQVPMVVGGKLRSWSMLDYATESIATNQWCRPAAQVLVDGFDRDRFIAAMAAEYANEQCEDLLRAGWQA